MGLMDDCDTCGRGSRAILDGLCIQCAAKFCKREIEKVDKMTSDDVIKTANNPCEYAGQGNE